MNIFGNIRNTMYMNKADKIMYHGKVRKLQEECSKFGMFRLADGNDEFNDDTLRCFYGEGETVGSIKFKKTFYFFYGNVCIVYYKSWSDRIIKVLVKSPEDAWKVTGYDNGEDNAKGLTISTTYVEVYDWWDVDWLSCGKSDYDSNMKPGNWWKSAYSNISSIYEEVAKKSVDYVLDNIYSEYERGQKA